MLPVAWVALLGLIAFIGSIGNIFIIGAVCLSGRLRVRGNAFVVNLALADLLVTCYIMPVGLASSRFSEEPFGSVLCDVNAFLLMTSCGVSTQSLMLIAIERYVHICKSVWYSKLFTRPLVVLYVTLTWVYTAAWTCQGWTGWTKYQYGVNVYVCLFYGPESLSYDLCLAFFGMLLPMMVLVFCYFNIFATVRRSSRAMAAHMQRLCSDEKDSAMTARLYQQRKKLSREKRLVLTLFVIVVLFVIFWLPAAVILVLSGMWNGDLQPAFFTVTLWAALCNSSMNSFLYGALNQNFRRGYQVFFNKLFCVNRCCPSASIEGHHLDNSSSQMSRSFKARRQESLRLAELARAEARNVQSDRVQEEISIADNEVVPEDEEAAIEVTEVTDGNTCGEQAATAESSTSGVVTAHVHSERDPNTRESSCTINRHGSNGENTQATSTSSTQGSRSLNSRSYTDLESIEITQDNNSMPKVKPSNGYHGDSTTVYNAQGIPETEM